MVRRERHVGLFMSRLWILEKVCSFWYSRPNVFVECQIKSGGRAKFFINFRLYDDNWFLELDMGNLVQSHTWLESVCFTITFDGDTGTFSEISNKNLGLLEQERGHILQQTSCRSYVRQGFKTTTEDPFANWQLLCFDLTLKDLKIQLGVSRAKLSDARKANPTTHSSSGTLAVIDAQHL